MSSQVAVIDVDDARTSALHPQPPNGTHRDVRDASALPRRTRPGNPGRGQAGTGRKRYDHDLIVRLYTAKRLTMQQVATQVGCHPRTVSAVLRTAGVTGRRRQARPSEPVPVLTAAEAADVLDRYTRLRQRVWQIISFTGHQAGSVLQVLHEAGIRLCDDRRPDCWPDREIVRRHRRGQSSTTIAAALGMNPETVRLRLDALGVPRRTVTHLTTHEQAEIVRRYTEDHEPISWIAAQLGRSRTTVRRALDAASHPPAASVRPEGEVR
jgi:transposase-like protein